MAILSMSSALTLLLYSGTVSTLQVTPNSPCASICLDNPNQDVSDPNTSTTSSSDITCMDSGFSNTTVGQKYASCINCLQGSTASAAGESDQEWFVYNLRYAFDACIFGFTNVTDAVSTPCSTSTSCGPLQDALKTGNLVPNNGSEFSYCSADRNAFLGAFLSQCMTCLQSTSNERYLANFLIALQAGCLQQPPTGTLIGLKGNIFSSTPINIMYPGYNQSATTSTKSEGHKGGLSQGAIIGISIGLGVLLIVTIAILFVCWRKRQTTKRLKGLHSPLDARFGAPNITSPNNGAYGNPYSSPPVRATQPFDPTAFSTKELDVLNNARSVLSKHQPTQVRDLKDPNLWEDPNARLASQLPTYTPGPAIPTHQAYIPGNHGPVSPVESNGTSSTYQASPYPSSRSSPKNMPPPAAAKHVPAPIQIPQQAQPQQAKHVPAPIQVPQLRNAPTATLAPQIKPMPPPLQTQMNQQSPNGATELHSAVSGRSIESSRIWPPGPHSQNQQHDIRPPSRSHSRADSWKRATTRIGIGNANASNEIPNNMRISGPMVSHGGRFDFELADRERLFREQTENQSTDWKFKKKKDDTPDSAESEELWPGNY